MHKSNVVQRFWTTAIKTCVLVIVCFLLFATSVTYADTSSRVVITPSTAVRADYSPTTITVVVGVNNTVSWVNNDNGVHTVTSDTAGIFDSGQMQPNQTFSYTFTKPGNYTYHCSYHFWMHGDVVVKPASAVPEFPSSTVVIALFASAVFVAIFAAPRAIRRDAR